MDNMYVEENSESARDVILVVENNPERLPCGCLKTIHTEGNADYVVSSSIPDDVFQDPQGTLGTIPIHDKNIEEALFLLNNWVNRLISYYTDQLVMTYIGMFSKKEIRQGETITHEGDTISNFILVFSGSIIQQKTHPPPCCKLEKMRVFTRGREIFADPSCAGSISAFDYVAERDSTIFIVEQRNINIFRAISYEIQRAKYLDVLKSIGCINKLSLNDLQRICEGTPESMVTVDYSTGYCLLKENEIPCKLYYIVHGKVVLQKDEHRKQLGAGEFFGLETLLGESLTYTVTVESLCTLVELDLKKAEIALERNLLKELQEEKANIEVLLQANDLKENSNCGEDDIANTEVKQRQSEEAGCETEGYLGKVIDMDQMSETSVQHLVNFELLESTIQQEEIQKIISVASEASSQLVRYDCNACLVESGKDTLMNVYVVHEGIVRVTLPASNHCTHLVEKVYKGGCFCKEALFKQSVCTANYSVYADTACTVAALDVNVMEAALGTTFIRIMKRRFQEFHDYINYHFANDDDHRFRDDVEIGINDVCHLEKEGRETVMEKTFMRCFNRSLNTVKPLTDALTQLERVTISKSYSALMSTRKILKSNETIVQVADSQMKILYIVLKGSVKVTYLQSNIRRVDREVTKNEDTFFNEEVLFLDHVNPFTAVAVLDSIVCELNAHILEANLGCSFKEILLRRKEEFINFLASFYETDVVTITNSYPETVSDSGASTDAKSQKSNREKHILHKFAVDALLSGLNLTQLLVEDEKKSLIESDCFCKMLKFEKNEIIYEQDVDTIKYVFVVYSGSVRTTCVPRKSSPSLLIQTFIHGEIFGTESLFRTGERSSSAYATTDVEVVPISIVDLENILHRSVVSVLRRNTEKLQAVFWSNFELMMPMTGWREPLLQKEVKTKNSTNNLSVIPNEKDKGCGKHLVVEEKLLKISQNESFSLLNYIQQTFRSEDKDSEQEVEDTNTNAERERPLSKNYCIQENDSISIPEYFSYKKHCNQRQQETIA